MMAEKDGLLSFNHNFGKEWERCLMIKNGWWRVVLDMTSDLNLKEITVTEMKDLWKILEIILQ